LFFSYYFSILVMGEKTTGVCKGDDGSVGVSLEDGEKLCLNANTNLSSLCRIVPTPCCHVFFFLFFFFFFFFFFTSLLALYTWHVSTCSFTFYFSFFFFPQKKHSWLLFYTRACSSLPQNAQKDELFKSFEECWCWVLTEN